MYNNPYNPYGGWQPNNQYSQPLQDNLNMYRQPYQPQQLNPPQAPTAPIQGQGAQTGGIIWVRGEEGAKAYLVAPGQSVQLFDTESDTFYIAANDISGMPLPLRIFDYKERTSHPSKSGAAVQPQQAQEFVPLEQYQQLAQQCAAMQEQLQLLAQKVDSINQPSVKSAKAKSETEVANNG